MVKERTSYSVSRRGVEEYLCLLCTSADVVLL
jgi:hypothetical protein